MARTWNYGGEWTRRAWLQRMSATAAVLGTAGPLRAFAEAAEQNPARKRACVLLWMSGGPSQLDTFDLKSGHENGGPFKAIDTSAPGVQISEHLPLLAKQMHHAAVVRSVTTKEGDHTRATYFVRTGALPQGPIKHPTLGSVFSKELGSRDTELPNYVSIAPNRFISPGAFGPGFLGPQYAPLIVGNPSFTPQPMTMDAAESLRVRNIELAEGVELAEADARLGLLGRLEEGFAAARPGVVSESHMTAYAKAVKMMRSTGVKAFNLDDEDDALRDAYGRNPFGQGCLLARRLIERGAPFVEVSLNGAEGQGAIGWDTHANNFEAVQQLSAVLDPGWATLLSDLDQRGLLESTLVVWMGEFGRTPQINPQQGRDHFPSAWTVVLSGGGVRGGQSVGRTSADGMQVEDRPATIGDVIATMALAVGIDPTTQNMSNIGRPIPVAPIEAKPLNEVVG